MDINAHFNPPKDRAGQIENENKGRCYLKTGKGIGGISTAAERVIRVMIVSASTAKDQVSPSFRCLGQNFATKKPKTIASGLSMSCLPLQA